MHFVYRHRMSRSVPCSNTLNTWLASEGNRFRAQVIPWLDVDNEFVMCLRKSVLYVMMYDDKSAPHFTVHTCGFYFILGIIV